MSAREAAAAARAAGGSAARGHLLALLHRWWCGARRSWPRRCCSTEFHAGGDSVLPVPHRVSRRFWHCRPRHRQTRLRGARRRSCAAAGLTGVTLYFLLENIALVYTTASNVGVIVSVAPVLYGASSRSCCCCATRSCDPELLRRVRRWPWRASCSSAAQGFDSVFGGGSIVGDVLAVGGCGGVGRATRCITRKIGSFCDTTISR